MGINYSWKTKAKASLKLYNHISSFLFEEEYGEIENNNEVKEALSKAKKALAKVIGNK